MPAKLTKIRRAAESYGVTISQPRRGSHWKATRPGSRSYILPAHKGARTELSDHYIAGFCRNFGIDLAEFKAKL